MAPPDANSKAPLSTSDVGGVFRELVRDRALASAVVANVLVLAFAIHSEFSPGNLLLVYWMQSVTFGLFHTARVCFLKEFSSASTRDGEDWSTAEARARGWETASLGSARSESAATFIFCWLLAHAVVLAPLFLVLSRESVAVLELSQLLQCVLVFALQQAFALVLDLRRDRRVSPRVDVLRWLPFARLAPLLAVILMSVPFGAGLTLLVVLAIAKTLGDGLVQMVESRFARA